MSSSTPSRIAGRSLPAFAALAFAGAAFLFSASASAKAEFPGVVQETLGMDCAPPCTICHTSPNGGSETISQPFYLNLAALDVPIDEESIPDLLDTLSKLDCKRPEDHSCDAGMPCKPCDVDGNNVSDIDDLTAGNDPNTGQPLACPKYGCGAHIAPERPFRNLDGTAALLVLGALGAIARRVRRS